jgi:ribosomal protein S18 acetylase RimI-like enzyme
MARDDGTGAWLGSGSRIQFMIERLREGDGPRLRALRLWALRDAPHAFATTAEEAASWSPEAWESQIATLPTFVWREGETDLGIVRGAVHDRDREAGYLLSMWVAPAARGRSIGAALVDAVVAWARERGLRRLILDVGVDNGPARALYLRPGFVATGATGTLPPPRERDRELELRLELD